ncbi:hypothetical protein ACNKHQ_23670 [Shigella flexneri]
MRDQHPRHGLRARLPQNITPEFVRDEGRRRARHHLPANINHRNPKPMIIGRNFLVRRTPDRQLGGYLLLKRKWEKLAWSTGWARIR